MLCLPLAGSMEVFSIIGLLAGVAFIVTIIVALVKFNTRAIKRHVVYAIMVAVLSCVAIIGGVMLMMALENNLLMTYCIRQMDDIAFSVPYANAIFTPFGLQCAIKVVYAWLALYVAGYVLTVCRFEYLLLTKYKGVDPDEIPPRAMELTRAFPNIMQ